MEMIFQTLVLSQQTLQCPESIRETIDKSSSSKKKRRIAADIEIEEDTEEDVEEKNIARQRLPHKHMMSTLEWILIDQMEAN